MSVYHKIQGFSKLSREHKIRIASEFAAHPVEFARQMISNWPAGKSNDPKIDFTENAVSDFRLPYSVAPNFLIDGKVYMVPMVTEESSVVAAASAAAKFWWDHGGFVTRVHNVLKPGHIHFTWNGSHESVKAFYNEISTGFKDAVKDITASMNQRGGGIERIELIDMSRYIQDYYQVEVIFNTSDAMGANFINTCLEAMAVFMLDQAEKKGVSSNLDVIMSILSNYTPECLVQCSVACPLNTLGDDFARRFETAVRIAQHDIKRAVTHNKGIFNGLDAVIIATGNDFRAVEAAGHSWASRTGSYKGLSKVKLTGTEFVFSMEVPLPIGVTGGITNIHPMAKASFQLLGNPGVQTLMSVIASAGMANHFSAIKALIGEGIQNGHMKLHLMNILNQLNADESEKNLATKYFSGRKVSFSGVKEFLSNLRAI